MTEIMNLFFQLTFSFAILVALFRIYKGPKDLDRMIAIEYLSILSVVFALWTSWITKEEVFFDVAIALAALSFIGTVSFSKWIVLKESK